MDNRVVTAFSRDGSFGGEQIVGESDLLPDAERRERPLDGDLDRPVPEPHLTAGQLPGLPVRSGQVGSEGTAGPEPHLCAASSSFPVASKPVDRSGQVRSNSVGRTS